MKNKTLMVSIHKLMCDFFVTIASVTDFKAFYDSPPPEINRKQNIIDKKENLLRGSKLSWLNYMTFSSPSKHVWTFLASL